MNPHFQATQTTQTVHIADGDVNFVAVDTTTITPPPPPPPPPPPLHRRLIRRWAR